MTPEERAEFEKQIKADITQMEEIKKAYGMFLKKEGIHYSDHQGFYVRIPLKNTDTSFTHVCDIRHGEILLADYCGNCYTKIRMAQRVAKAIKQVVKEAIPLLDSKFDIRPEHYGASFELTIYWEIKYKDIQDLHERVLAIANVVDIGAGIGKEMLGDEFGH